jgi:Ser-tRNA(Ala) deacylase AlaX
LLEGETVMATLKRYLASGDLTCTATVTGVVDLGDRLAIRCDQSIFHARGGGAIADCGRLGGHAVIDVRHAEEGEVDHYVAGGIFSVGQVVEMEVDAARREESSRWHSAGHLIADCVTALDPHLKATRGHHWPGEGRVEFAGDAVGLGALVEHLTEAMKRAIADDVPFRIVGDPYRNRALQIGSNAPIPCGGTHVASAGALNGLTIRKVQQKEGLLRIGYCF